MKRASTLQVGNVITIPGGLSGATVTGIQPQNIQWPMTVAVQLNADPAWVALPAEGYF